VSALGLAACGGSDNDSDQPSAAQAADAKAISAIGDKLDAAYKRKDAAKVCALIDPQGLKKQFGGAKGCQKRLAGAFNRAENSNLQFQFEDITIDGDTAVAQSTKSGQGEVYFKRVKGEWYIDANPSADSSAGAPE
jgi:hypothetical protein